MTPDLYTSTGTTTQTPSSTAQTDPYDRVAQMRGLGGLRTRLEVLRGPSAEDMRTQLLRSQFEEAKKRWWPLEDELFASYKNPLQRQLGLQDAMATFNRSADAADASANRQLAGLGITLTPEQQAVRDKESATQRGLGEVEAYNRTARRFDDRDNAILSGGLSGMKSSINSTLGL